MITITQNGNSLTISSTYQSGEFLREVEIEGVFAHIDGIAKTGDFTTPTISLGGSSLTLEFATKKANRFDGADSITLQFGGPVAPTSAFGHIQGFPDGSSIKVPISIIPEPGSVLIGALWILILLRRRR